MRHSSAARLPDLLRHFNTSTHSGVVRVTPLDDNIFGGGFLHSWESRASKSKETLGHRRDQTRGQKATQECGEAWGVGAEAAWATYFIRVALVTKHGDISVGIRQDENGSRMAVVHGGRRDVVVRPRTRTAWISFHHNKILSGVKLTPPNQTLLL